jgi:hypothetical protein
MHHMLLGLGSNGTTRMTTTCIILRILARSLLSGLWGLFLVSIPLSLLGALIIYEEQHHVPEPLYYNACVTTSQSVVCGRVYK